MITNRADFIEHIRQELGEPVIRLNVSTDQVDHAVDDAMQFWREYFVDASERTYLAHKITASDLANKYITVPDNVIAVRRVCSPRQFGGLTFDAQYMFMFDTVFNMGSVGISDYFIARQYISELTNILNPEPGFRFRYNTNRIYIEDFSTKIYQEDQYVVVELDAYLDETAYFKLWNDRRLKELARAYLKKIWGNNMKKFSGVTLPSGIVMNGSEIYADALQEIQEIEDDIRENQEPLSFVVA